MRAREADSNFIDYVDPGGIPIAASEKGALLRLTLQAPPSVSGPLAAEIIVKTGLKTTYAERRLCLYGDADVVIREAGDGMGVRVGVVALTGGARIYWSWIHVDPRAGDGALLLAEQLAAGSTDVPAGAYECELVRAAGGGTYQWSTPWSGGAITGPAINLPTAPVRVYPAGATLTLSAPAQVVWRLRCL